ncbi:RNA polymerase sigma factor [Saccharopolyspora gloriosae]|uniref:RNA polymerase sigma factor n=1 Tax=Saccharopolyspora gloriosae TaxID=455344 RepID=UPI001FB68A6E|nr:sigma-70 family RNA polymerase sigma factor [Saccharopolyspora gloriosae]
MKRPQVQPDPAAALLGLYDEALPQVYGYLLGRTGDHAVSEDLAADTFLAAVKAARERPEQAPTVAWLVGIARHKLADHWRAVGRERLGLERLGQEESRVEDPWDVRLDVLWAREVLGRLGSHHRAALTLRYLDGLPVPEVAEHLGRTVHATEALLVRARAAFRRDYERTSDTQGTEGGRGR